jgi:hypothetical protein
MPTQPSTTLPNDDPMQIDKWRTPKLLDGFKCEFEVKIAEE